MKEISINVADMSKDQITSQFLILPVIPNKKIIRVEKDRMDGSAVVLECERDRALAIVHVIRYKWSKNLFRCYDGTKRI